MDNEQPRHNETSWDFVRRKTEEIITTDVQTAFQEFLGFTPDVVLKSSSAYFESESIRVEVFHEGVGAVAEIAREKFVIYPGVRPPEKNLVNMPHFEKMHAGWNKRNAAWQEFRKGVLSFVIENLLRSYQRHQAELRKDEIRAGDICKTNLSQPGGMVKVLRIEPHWADPRRTCAFVEHLENHPYGYPIGDTGYYMIEDLIKMLD